MQRNQTIRSSRDRSRRFRYRPKTGVPDGAEWFANEIQRFLASQRESWKPLTCLAAQLVLFEAVLAESDLTAALLASPYLRRADGAVLLEWPRKDGRLDRRILASFVAASATKIPVAISESDIKKTISELEAWSGNPLHKLMTAGRAWAFLNLPGWIFAHICMDAPLTPLPQSAWARKSSLLSLANNGHANHEGFQSQEKIIDRFISGSLSAGGLWLVESLLKIVTPRVPGASHAYELKAKLAELNTLADQTEYADRISSLLLGWAIELITHGGVRGEPVAPATLRNYLSSCTRQIHAALSGKEIESMQGDDFEKIYQDIVATQSAGRRQITATAVNGWHTYLQNLLDVFPIRAIVDDTPQTPNANIIWPHERDRVFNWLDASLPARLNQAQRVALSIAFNTRIRITELLYLRIRAVFDRGEYFEIHIAPGRSDSKPKTESGRRAVLISNAQAIAILREWLHRREAEHALTGDYLFGDPYAPERIYSPGAMTLRLHSLLKATSGDRTASFHTLSHTWVSESIAKIDHEQPSEINHIEAVSIKAGHRASSTTLTQYFHLYEAPLRTNLNDALKSIQISSIAAERWSGTRAATIRKRASLSNQPLNSIAWNALLEEKFNSESIQDIKSCFALTAPDAPDFLAINTRQNQPTIHDVLRILRDLTEGKTISEVACRIDYPSELVHRIAAQADQLLRQSQYRRLPSHRDNCRKSAASLLQQFCQKNASHLDFKRSSQNKFLSLAKWFGRKPDDLNEVCNTWLQAWRWGYVDLSVPQHRDILFTLLREAAIPAKSLAVGFSSNQNKSKHPTIELKPIAACSAAFQRIFDTTPNTFLVGSRRDRPNIYLIWSSSEIRNNKNPPPPASSSLAGFNAWMFAASVFCRLIKEKNDDEKIQTF